MFPAQLMHFLKYAHCRYVPIMLKRLQCDRCLLQSTLPIDQSLGSVTDTVYLLQLARRTSISGQLTILHEKQDFRVLQNFNAIGVENIWYSSYWRQVLIASVFTWLAKVSPESIFMPRILISLENSTDVS